MPNSKLTYKTLTFILFAFLLFGWAVSYHIHSSELWSIYVAKYILNPDYSTTMLMKPLFHLILSIVHLAPLNDVQHLIVVKTIFSIIGLAQVYLMIEIFRFSFKDKLAFTSAPIFLLLLFSFSSVYYLQNFFRVRTDQVCITVFLLFIYLNLKNKLSFKYHVLFILIYPLIGLKGVIFSLLHSLQTYLTYKNDFKLTRKSKFFYTLTILTIAIWLTNLGWNSFIYFMNTIDSFSSYFQNLRLWLSTDWALILITLISLFHVKFQQFIESKIKINSSLLATLSLVIIFLFPQKHPYFIASFLPLLTINAVLFIIYIFDQFKNNKPVNIFIKVSIAAFICLKIFFMASDPPYRSNQSQFKLITYLSEVITLNNLSYIDGMGALPRGNNLNCFVSPDDELTNRHCLEIIEQGSADVVVMTSRLLWLIRTPELLDKNYNDAGFSIYIRKNLDFKSPMNKEMLPAILVFGLEN